MCIFNCAAVSSGVYIYFLSGAGEFCSGDVMILLLHVQVTFQLVPGVYRCQLDSTNFHKTRVANFSFFYSLSLSLCVAVSMRIVQWSMPLLLFSTWAILWNNFCWNTIHVCNSGGEIK